MVEKAKNLIERRNKIFRDLLGDPDYDFSSTLNQLTNNDIDPKDICTTLVWDNDNLANLPEDEQKQTLKLQEFIQKLFNEYQINCANIIADTHKEAETETYASEEEKNNAILRKTEDKAIHVIIDMIMKAINWSNKVATEYSEDKYKQDLEDMENLYFNMKAENTKLINENTDLKDELEKLKNKKFLGVFKVN